MELQDIQKTLETLSDNQVVQGHLLGRIEQAIARHDAILDRHEDILNRHGRAIESIANGMVTLQSVVARVVDAVQEMQGGIRQLAEGQKVMQASMDHLFQRMDRFIRGLESNGHEQG
jgi:uncharacterized phage infection (PIP) family protein YhgE